MEEAANAVIDVAPTFKGEDHMVCRTPAFPAGTTTVEISLNGRDFHGATPPLKHRFACEQHDPLNVVGATLGSGGRATTAIHKISARFTAFA